jgi:thioredoxin reductase (NADPH)
MHTERPASHYDVLLVGAGPAGVAAALHFKHHNLRALHVEEGQLAQTIRNFPTGVRLFSARKDLALPGFPFTPDPENSPTREEYIAYLEQTAAAAGLNVHTAHRAVTAHSNGSHHMVTVTTPSGRPRQVATANLVVASGGYFSPNILEIEGETLSNVHHYFRSELVAPGRRFVVVGGRNSAIEAAVNIAEAGAEVVLVYRKSRLPRGRIKPWLLPRFDSARRRGRIRVHYRTVPEALTEGGAHLVDEAGGRRFEPADTVFLLTGYGPDYRLLRETGVRFHRQTGRPLFDPDTLETKTPGVFLCGTVVLKAHGEQATIENTRDHARRMLPRVRERLATGSLHGPS